MFKVVKTTRRNRRSMSPVERADPAQADKTAMAFFDAESASAFLRPWLRLERGLRLQKFRQFAEEYPGLNTEEKEGLYKVLVKANDAKLLNTKQQIQYESERIQSIRGLKMTRVGDAVATFKIDTTIRPTKKVPKSLQDSQGVLKSEEKET
jgi:hypothetical protein